MLELFLPELSALADLPYRKEFHTEDPFGQTLLALSYTGPDVVLRLASWHAYEEQFTIFVSQQPAPNMFTERP